MPTEAVGERTLETLVGPLAETFPQLDRATIPHSDQLTTETRTNPELRNQWFYTADSALYTVEKEGRRDEVFLYLGREPTNPIFNNIGEATQQLIRTGNYVLDKEKNKDDIEAVKSADTTLRVKLSDLKLQGDNSEWRYFEIETANYDKLNPEQRRVAERVYGQGEDFVQNMAMLSENDTRSITKTRVYVLNPDYVKNTVQKDSAIARASWLSGFDYDSRFFAVGGGVFDHGGLRGVRNVVAEGDAPKIGVDPVANAYDTLLNNPRRALELMTLKKVAGLLGLVITYLNQQKQ